MKRECDRIWQVDALREGALSRKDAESHERHRATCSECRDRFAGDARIVALGRALPGPKLDEVRVRRVRMQLLRKAAAGASSLPRVRWLLPALAFAAAASMGAILTHRQAPVAPVRVAPVASAPGVSAFSASVDGRPGARWDQKRDGGTERVRLEEGTIALSVRHQEPGERCLVDLPDGELEVRGTRFEVTAHDGRTRSVQVAEGAVALRLRDAPERSLAAGEAWKLDDDTRPPTPRPRAAAVATSAPAAPPVIPAAPSATADAVDEYTRAMELYGAHRWAAAAGALHAFTASHPDAPEADDAEFLEASSLAYAGRPDAAAIVAEHYLDRHPHGFHARDAAVLVARSARDRGDCAKARAVLAPWTGAKASADVTAALGACGR
ncbi:MAG TPA: FecR domain-containing protein [Polyangiaceae bacterium]